MIPCLVLLTNCLFHSSTVNRDDEWTAWAARSRILSPYVVPKPTLTQWYYNRTPQMIAAAENYEAGFPGYMRFGRQYCIDRRDEFQLEFANLLRTNDYRDELVKELGCSPSNITGEF